MSFNSVYLLLGLGLIILGTSEIIYRDKFVDFFSKFFGSYSYSEKQQKTMLISAGIFEITVGLTILLYLFARL